MSLQRYEILQHLRSLLLGKAPWDQSVHVHLGQNLKLHELPAVLITSGDDRAKVLDDAPRAYTRTVLVQFDLLAAAADSATLDRTVHEMCETLEQTVLADQYQGFIAPRVARANDTRLVGCTLRFEDGAPALVSGAVIEIEVDYIWKPATDTAEDIAALTSAGVTIDMPGVGSAADLQDEVPFSQG